MLDKISSLITTALGRNARSPRVVEIINGTTKVIGGVVWWD